MTDSVAHRIEAVREQVKEYYGRTVRMDRSRRVGCSCSSESMPEEVRAMLPLIEPEIIEQSYGCGSPIPPDLAGLTVLDLGCGTGRDAFLASKLVGSAGRVIGVDMTEEQLVVARRHVEAQSRKLGLPRPNVEFCRGYIEDLTSAGIADESIDVVISNCVINLSPAKDRVFGEVFRVLRPGGELFFSDVFAGRRFAPAEAADPILHGECLAGAMYEGDFRRILRNVGCLDYRAVERRPFPLRDPNAARRLGGIDFYSLTVRAFKLDGLEDAQEDYGQVATYMGTLPGLPAAFAFDERQTFPAGKAVAVSGNTAVMLQQTRYARHFSVVGDQSVHHGPFSGSRRSSVAVPEFEAPTCCG